YFFFFGMVVFTVLYFFVRLLTGCYGFRFSRFLALVFEAVLGVGLAAFLLLPSILAILGNSRLSDFLLGWNAILYGKEQIYANVLGCFFFPPDLPARPVFFPQANVKWSSLGGWLPVFSTVGVFVLGFEKKKNWMKRLLGICIFMAMIPLLNSMFYAFNTSYYARWFYMPILIMSLATVTLTEDRSISWWRGWRWVFFITLTVSLVLGFFPQKDADGNLIFGLYTQGEDYTYLLRYWASCLIALVSLLILGLLLRLLQKNRVAFYRTAMICVCLITVIYGNVFIATGRTHSYEIKEVMIDQLIEGKVDLDKGNYRIDVYDGVDNTGMYLGLPSINAFHSIVPSSVMDFYEYVGESRSVASRPSIKNEALRPLLSVKYLLNRTGGESFIEEDGTTKMSGYGYRKTSGGYYVYENENYIPYGFSYQYYMTQDFCDSYDEDDRAALMLKAVLLDAQQIARYGSWMTDLSTLEDDGSNWWTDETTTLSTSEKAMAYDAAQLKETAAEYFETTKEGFSATVSRSEKSLVFFSVPFDEGWTATVNGAPVKIEKVNVGFMAVPVAAGRSTITFTYRTPGLTLGIYLSLGATAIFILYMLIALIVRHKNPSTTVYREGDRLLHRWRADDLIEVTAQELDLPDEDPLPSILDDPPIIIPKLHDGFSGGFTVNEDVFDDHKNT
ncbi:MAG: YfhO family protein, partial [Clostridia bacterium]|nr:YfhO family protein [Clostridia bacterium]